MLRAIREEAARGAETPHRKRRTFRGTLILAAALVLVLALITTGFATEWFGLSSLGQREEPSDWGSGQETMLRLQGLTDSPACPGRRRMERLVRRLRAKCGGYYYPGRALYLLRLPDAGDDPKAGRIGGGIRPVPAAG